MHGLQSVYMCFLDFNNAFDKVQHNHLLKLLREKRIGKNDVRIIKYVYFNQAAWVYVGNEFSDKTRSKERMYSLANAFWFVLTSEDIIEEA